MTGLRAQLRGVGPTVRLLCLNQFGINLGFYMLMPYLAGHLTGDLGLAAGVAGFVLGVRNLCQQGMFLLGGTLADRLGYRSMIIAGCVLRTVAFVLLAAVPSLPGLLVGMAATGVAGALFNPAVRAYLAASSGERRVESFAVFNVFYQAGILVGPVVGLAATALDFTVTCAVAAFVFAVLALAQLRYLPAHDAGEAEKTSIARTWRTVAANRRFVAFSLVMTVPYVLGFQIYLAFPLLVAAESAIVGTMLLFAVTGLVTIACQVRVTAWCRSRWGPETSMERGILVMAAAFLPPAAAVGLDAAGAVLVACAVAGAVLLAAATMIIYPFEMDTVVAMSRGRHVATHYGLYSSVAGVGIAAGNTIIGTSLDTAGTTVPWLAMAALGVLGAVGLRTLRRRGLLSPAAEPAGELVARA
ncbi:MFS transporter [Phytomonospora endophytica]|uniref:MFS family permease n=1 Tax=Phytomonospora endophytica TaxID=714109 RepID=A0A841FQW0_9ACTN|nr:MFS transporter [Phytomonospora endophytica]MBB6038555.1 MFS family permease [Phytomonospora endophytica]GIG69305.1 putative ABC transport system membrane protein [Phytomonospora endophytica]